MSEKRFKDIYQVQGVGRVGSYATAKQAGRSRARKYWGIAEWNNSCKSKCKCKETGIHYPIGWEVNLAYGKYKTKKDAQEAVNKTKKPTIEELEDILDQEEDVHIEILPNGEIRSTGQTGDTKPITMRESLGGEY